MYPSHPEESWRDFHRDHPWKGWHFAGAQELAPQEGPAISRTNKSGSLCLNCMNNMGCAELRPASEALELGHVPDGGAYMISS